MKIKLSNTSKMPCKSWGIPAKYCNVGSRLAEIVGSICEECYAGKGAYNWPDVENAYQVRLDQFNENKVQWTESITKTLKRRKNTDFFRWFDSGDLQSVDMLESIVSVASATPETLHWLPTRETGILSAFIQKHGDCIPENLIIRISDNFFDSEPKKRTGILARFATSGASKTGNHNCPASEQQGKCGDCRKCWDKNERVVYKAH